MFEGPTMRDYFAARALTGLLAAEGDSEGNGAFRMEHGRPVFTTKPENFAAAAYLLADAMVAARQVAPEPPATPS
jgi:hypothetical protein